MKSEVRKTPLDAWIGQKIGGNNRVAGLTSEAIRTYQLNRLRETIGYARRKSPFYGTRLAHFFCDTISDLREVESLPFTTANDIRINPWRFLAVSQDEIARIVTLRTSGTTGDSKRLFFTVDDLDLTVDFFCHGMSTLVDPKQRVLILLPGEKPDSVGDLLRRGLSRMNVEGIIHGPVCDVQTTVNEIVHCNIDCLVGIPTQVLALARNEAGQAVGKNTIKSILLSTDYVPRAIVNELDRVWGCTVYNHYGMTEMGLGGGVECDAHGGYHLREADLYFEVVDPFTGEPLPDGETGEVVFTTLTRKGMPLIRYRTGDVGRFIPEPCPCGSALRRLGTIRGRWDGRVTITPETILTLPDMDEVLFSLPGLINYQATLVMRGEKTCLEIAVFGEWSERPQSEIILKTLEKVPAIRDAVARDYLEPLPVRFVERNWFTTGTTKRKIIDERYRR